MRAIPSPSCRTVPTSARSVSPSYSSIRCLRIEGFSFGRNFKGCAPLGPPRLAAQPLQAAADGGVESVGSNLQDDAADQVGVDAARGLVLAARTLVVLATDIF